MPKILRCPPRLLALYVACSPVLSVVIVYVDPDCDTGAHKFFVVKIGGIFSGNNPFVTKSSTLIGFVIRLFSTSACVYFQSCNHNRQDNVSATLIGGAPLARTVPLHRYVRCAAGLCRAESLTAVHATGSTLHPLR